MIDYQYSYLVGTIFYLIVWVILFWHRKDLQREMLVMSFLIGLMGLATNYYWWNVDWWHPPHITNTPVGIEDFLIGFASGGAIAVIYEEILKKRYYKSHVRRHVPGVKIILLLLAQLTFWLLWGLHLTSFVGSSIAMLTTASVMFYYRKDLFWKGFLTALLTPLISLVFYYPIIFSVPNWVNQTYRFNYLSGRLVLGIPIEELIFWFFAGLVFGPLYEYWQGIRLVSMRVRR